MLDLISMDEIITEVRTVVRNWEKNARSIGLLKAEQEMMIPAFRF